MSKVTAAVLVTGLFALLMDDRLGTAQAQTGTQYVVGVSGMT